MSLPMLKQARVITIFWGQHMDRETLQLTDSLGQEAFLVQMQPMDIVKHPQCTLYVMVVENLCSYPSKCSSAALSKNMNIPGRVIFFIWL